LLACEDYPGCWVGDNGQVFLGRQLGAGPAGVLRTFLTDSHGNQRGLSVGRLVLTTFTGPPPEEGMVVRYRNNDRGDCRLSNIY
jgi:HNH endonuclease